MLSEQFCCIYAHFKLTTFFVLPPKLMAERIHTVIVYYLRETLVYSLVISSCAEGYTGCC
jgi:hypothetical protein